MVKKNAHTKKYQQYVMPTLLGIVIILVAIAGFTIHETAETNPSAPKSKPGYVNGQEAVHQVSEFYRLYPAKTNSAAERKVLVASYGDGNLSFYDQYYRHGFDPMVCSTMMPTKVTTSLVSAGSIAVVNVRATYPDGTSQIITARVTADPSLAIDSITCPGTKGGLPPAN